MNWIVMMKLTDHGAKSIVDATKVINEANKTLHEKGGKLKDFYLTMGDVDYIAICEAPKDDIILAFAAKLASTGIVRTTTLKAFTAEQVQQIVI